MSEATTGTPCVTASSTTLGRPSWWLTSTRAKDLARIGWMSSTKPVSSTACPCRMASTSAAKRALTHDEVLESRGARRRSAPWPWATTWMFFWCSSRPMKATVSRATASPGRGLDDDVVHDESGSPLRSPCGPPVVRTPTRDGHDEVRAAAEPASDYAAQPGRVRRVALRDDPGDAEADQGRPADEIAGAQPGHHDVRPGLLDDAADSEDRARILVREVCGERPVIDHAAVEIGLVHPTGMPHQHDVQFCSCPELVDEPDALPLRAPVREVGDEDEEPHADDSGH